MQAKIRVSTSGLQPRNNVKSVPTGIPRIFPSIGMCFFRIQKGRTCISFFTKLNEKQWYLPSLYLLVIMTHNCSPEYYAELLSLAIPLDTILVARTELYIRMTCSRWGQVDDHRYRITFVPTDASWTYHKEYAIEVSFFCQFGFLIRSSGIRILTNSCPWCAWST